LRLPEGAPLPIAPPFNLQAWLPLRRGQQASSNVRLLSLMQLTAAHEPPGNVGVTLAAVLALLTASA
jgi:hypothetical protein